MSDAEDRFLGYWHMLARNAPEPVREFSFARPRRFRFDFAWPDNMIAFEVEGGVYVHGRHTRPSGFSMDIEKYNLAALMGYRIFRATPQQIDSNPQQIVNLLLAALAAPKEG